MNSFEELAVVAKILTSLGWSVHDDWRTHRGARSGYVSLVAFNGAGGAGRIVIMRFEANDPWSVHGMLKAEASFTEKRSFKADDLLQLTILLHHVNDIYPGGNDADAA